MAKKAREYVPNPILYNLRDAAGLTQEELARELNNLPLAKENGVKVDAVTVSRWERGVVERPSPIHRRLLAQFFGVSLEELGFTRPKISEPRRPPRDVDIDAFLVDQPADVDPHVQEDRERWRATRDQLNAHRVPLAAVAAQLYNADARFSDTSLLAPGRWIPRQPVALGSITLSYDPTVDPPVLTGTEKQARATRPLASEGSRYGRYSQALREVGHPGLFENRLSYRLLDVRWENGSGKMRFGPGTYFDTMDICETTAHETAAALLRLENAGATGVGRPSWKALPFRRLIGDPFDLYRRVLVPSIDTLTIRKAKDGVTFVLHDRNADRVAIAGGMLHVMPAGVFQPSSVLPAAQQEDFDLWRNMMREYSEEFLGNAEHGGDGAPVDYGSSPFDALQAGRQAGRVRAWCLGVGLDALTLFGEILTVAVFDAEVYDEVFADMVHTNDEGRVVLAGGSEAKPAAIPFDGLTVPRLLEHESFAPAAAACLRLAWEHRDFLLET